MRIGVDATSWLNPRGYGRFARNAVRRLVELDADSTYRLYIDSESAADADLPAGAEIHRVRLSQSATGARADSSRRVRDLVRLAWAVRAKDVDVFLFPSDYTYFPVTRVPAVVGVHDTIANELPELTLARGRHRLFWQAKQRVALARAARIFTVSEAARVALSARLGLPADAVAVVPEAPDPVFSPRPRSAIDRECRAVGLEPGDSFFLFAGGISPHKNVETLIEAYALLPGGPTRPKLVIVGSLDGGPYLSSAASLHAGIERYGLGGSALLTGFVEDETLACLYSGATATVLPSLAEGFGLPAVEAAACGSPMVVSDLAAHRESLGDAALYFQPKDVKALAEHLRRIGEDESTRRDLATRGQAAVSRLSWDKTAEILHDLLAEVAAANGRRT